jgi:LysW-gamma-L-lysine carboxypeptidase
MLEIPSPPGDERRIAAFLVERLGELGFTAEVDAAGNAVGTIGRSGPLLVLLGHLDTVPGDIPVRVEGDVLHGRGAVDAKGPLACLVCAAALAHSRTPARIVVAGAVEEEAESRGACALRERLSPDALVIGEPSGANGVVLGYKGVTRLQYEVARAQSHPASPHEKAVETAAEFWAAVRDAVRTRYPVEAPMFERAIPTLIRLEGDLGRARAAISCRTPPGFDPGWLAEVAERARNGGSVTVVERVEAVVTTRDDPVVRALSAAIRARDGTPRLKVKAGTSDMNVVAPVWRVPMAAYGPGDSSLDHTPEERIDLPEFLRATETLAAALPEIAAAVGPGEVDPGGLSEEEERLISERLEALGYLG